MLSQSNVEDALGVGASVLVLITLLGLWFYARYLKAHPGKALRAWAVALVVDGWIAVHRGRQASGAGQYPGDAMDFELWFLSGSLFGFFAVPLVVKLYCKWVGGELTPEEKAPGAEGVRAWLKGGNLVLCLLSAFCAWKGFGYSFWGILVLGLVALLAYPLLGQWSPGQPSRQPPAANPPLEPEPVLQGGPAVSIPAEQGAPLTTSRSTVKSPSELMAGLNPERRLILAGGALVLLGFFLPWFSVNPSNEIVNRLAQQVRQVLPGLPEGAVGLGVNTPSLNIAGPDIAHGLGWLVLVLGVAAVVLSFLSIGLERQVQQTLALTCLAMGTCVLAYLLSQNLHWVNAGIILALVGYALQFAGILKKRPVQLSPAG